MLRYCAWPIIVLCVFATSVSAEKITSHRSIELTDELRSASLNASDLLDESFQNAVIDAAPSDWRDSMGTDVWWVPSEGANIQVMVFPTLHRPGNGQPGCCLHFETDGTEFWLKIRGTPVSVPDGNLTGESGPGQQPGGAGPSTGNETPLITPNGLGGEGGAAGGPNGPAGEGGAPVGPGTGGPGNSQNATSDGPGAPEGTGTDTAREVLGVIAQVPEPGILVLLGMAGLAASRRIRRR